MISAVKLNGVCEAHRLDKVRNDNDDRLGDTIFAKEEI